LFCPFVGIAVSAILSAPWVNCESDGIAITELAKVRPDSQKIDLIFPWQIQTAPD
jgi:hypothetical protein